MVTWSLLPFTFHVNAVLNLSNRLKSLSKNNFIPKGWKFHYSDPQHGDVQTTNETNYIYNLITIIVYGTKNTVRFLRHVFLTSGGAYNLISYDTSGARHNKLDATFVSKIEFPCAAYLDDTKC